MKYALAFIVLCLPAILAAKGSCQMPEKAQVKAGTAFSLTVGWQTSPLLAEHVL
jgi:hypothetical protein